MERIPFVGLHAHCGVGSPFDGFGYPEDHMEFAYSNGSKALASILRVPNIGLFFTCKQWIIVTKRS